MVADQEASGRLSAFDDSGRADSAMPASATETARIKVTANSLLRQLEQSSTATEPNHLATLKRQAVGLRSASLGLGLQLTPSHRLRQTAKHVKQLLASLEGR